MHAFEVLGDPVRRRILNELVDGEKTAGDLTSVIQAEFDISQPAVSHHLRVLRESGFASVRRDGAKRLYSIGAEGFQDADQWLERFRKAWTGPLEALATEVARGKRERKPR